MHDLRAEAFVHLVHDEPPEDKSVRDSASFYELLASGGLCATSEP